MTTIPADDRAPLRTVRAEEVQLGDELLYDDGRHKITSITIGPEGVALDLDDGARTVRLPFGMCVSVGRGDETERARRAGADLAVAARSVRWSARDLADRADRLTGVENVVDLVHAAAAVDEAVRLARMARARIDEAAAPRLPLKPVDFDGIVAQRITSYARDSWASDDLHAAVRRHVIGWVSVDPETGEVNEAAADAAARALDLVAEVYRLDGGSARLEPLRQAGIDPDDYSRKRKDQRVRIVSAP